MIHIIIILVVLLLCFWFYKKILVYALFNDFYTGQTIYTFVNDIYKRNKFYNYKYKSFFNRNKECTAGNFSQLPYLTKEELIEFNDEIITAPYKKCNLTCTNSCINDPLWYNNDCSIGQSTGGTSGKSTFVWMNKYNER